MEPTRDEINLATLEFLKRGNKIKKAKKQQGEITSFPGVSFLTAIPEFERNISRLE